MLYLLHGIGGDENEWPRGGTPDVILDNLYADKKLVPMIVVMPNGRAGKDVTARDPFPKQGPAFAAFEEDLLKDLIPFVEKTYSVKADRESRAIAGLSMGGGQSLNFGLNNLDTFAWVGGFSSAPNTRRPADLIKDHAEAAKKLKLLYVACGDKDGLFRISEGVHKMLDEKKVPHVYRVIPERQARLQGVEERPVPLRPTDLPRAGAGEQCTCQEGRRTAAGQEGTRTGRR